MIKKELKVKLNKGHLTLGSWIMAGNTLTTEILASFGFDWLAIDMEHSAFSAEEMIRLIQVIELSGVTPLVRVAANDERLIKTAMDAGAYGVIVPMVNSLEDAKRAVDAVYYPPRGTRGVGLGRAARYGLKFEEYKKGLKQNAIVIVQIEHKKAMRELKNILSVDGVDGSMIGPYDLSGSMGFPGEFHRKDVQAFLDEYRAVSRSVGKPAGYHVVIPDLVVLKKMRKLGYTFLAYGTDALFLIKGIQDIKNEMKG